MGAEIILAAALGGLSAGDAVAQNQANKKALEAGIVATRAQGRQATDRLAQEFAVFTGQARTSSGERGSTGAVERSATVRGRSDVADIRTNTNIAIGQLETDAESRFINPITTAITGALQGYLLGGQLGLTGSPTTVPSFSNPGVDILPSSVNTATANTFNPLTGVLF